MKKCLTIIMSLTATLTITGCLDGGKGGPFPTLNKTPTSGSSTGGIIFVPTSPTGEITASDAKKLTTSGGDISKMNDLANPENGGPSKVATGLSMVPGFGALSLAEQLAIDPSNLHNHNVSDLSSSPLESCYKVTGSNKDIDQDNIPKSLGWSFDCSLDIQPEGKFSFSGSFLQEDADDNKAFPAAGYSYVYDNLTYSTKYHGYDSRFIFNGFFKYFQEGRSLKMESSYEHSYESTSPQAQHDVGTYGYYMNWVMTPTTPSAPYDDGRLEFSGFLKDTVGNGDLVLEFSSKNLTYGCQASGFFKSGSITYADGSNNKIVYTYNNCNETITFNGKTMQAVTH